ncbi:hypothetical protein [Phenylobacterium sp.]|uniref:hypothetical protein n=1 Tax=Phenylobacterium sp. TaxID=1871053 RepID=UPI0035B0E903
MSANRLTHGELRSELLALNVGHLIIIWAQIDAVLSGVSRILFEFMGGHPSEAALPRSFSRKLAFVRKCYAAKAELAPDGAAMAAILSRAAKLVIDRNTLAHGALIDEGAGSLTMLRLDMIKSDELDVREYTPETVSKVVMESADLLSDLIALAWHLKQFIPDDLVGHSGSELAQEFVRRFPPIDLTNEEAS